jgi:hypothetical protein
MINQAETGRLRHVVGARLRQSSRWEVKIAGARQQGLVVLAPVRGNGESWSRGCGAELKPPESAPAACLRSTGSVK